MRNHPFSVELLAMLDVIQQRNVDAVTYQDYLVATADLPASVLTDAAQCSRSWPGVPRRVADAIDVIRAIAFAKHGPEQPRLDRELDALAHPDPLAGLTAAQIAVASLEAALNQWGPDDERVAVRFLALVDGPRSVLIEAMTIAGDQRVSDHTRGGLELVHGAAVDQHGPDEVALSIEFFGAG